MPNTKQEIFSAIQKNKEQIRQLGVKRLGLFGSFVREEQNAGSDIDFLVEFEPDQKTFDNLVRLSATLKTIFNLPVELVTHESLSPYIKPYVLEEIEYEDIIS